MDLRARRGEANESTYRGEGKRFVQEESKWKSFLPVTTYYHCAGEGEGQAGT